MNAAQFPLEEEDLGDKMEEREGPIVSRPIGDLPTGAVTLEADHKLIKVYGDCIHQSDGHKWMEVSQMIDTMWQDQWAKAIALPTQCYKAPGGTVGQ
jgi:hypothetical protein